LHELGVAEFDARLLAAVEPIRSASVQAATGTAPHPVEPIVPVIPAMVRSPERPVEPRQPGVSRLSTLPSLADRPSAKRSVISQSAQTTPQVKSALMSSTENDLSDPNSKAILSIREDIGRDCTRCKLATLGRTQVVNSVGNFNADLMFVGEAPGADEDLQGEPFVGRAGQLLTDIIEKGLQIPRKNVFIGNINRCRPPQNRAPEPDETLACKPFLLREIDIVKPKVIVVLGATAAHNLLETKIPIGKLRGQFHDYQGSKVMPTFHPAYLLRDPHKKREVWEDMKMVRDYLTNSNNS
jgi:DNA polymerase